MKRAAIPVAAAVAAASLTGCTYRSGCTPTRTTARPAEKVNLADPMRSSVIESKLTARGKALSGQTMLFEVLDGDARVYQGQAKTGKDGYARIDMKQVDDYTLVALARATRFRTGFRGSATYCPSEDAETFDTVRSPVPLPTGSLPPTPVPVPKTPRPALPTLPVVPTVRPPRLPVPSVPAVTVPPVVPTAVVPDAPLETAEQVLDRLVP